MIRSVVHSPEDERAQLEVLGRRQYPEEACAVVLARQGDRRIVVCGNAARRQERGCRYLVSGHDLARIGLHVAAGWLIDTIFHSHPNAAAAFSSVDREMAMADGVPFYPNATYKILEIRSGEPKAWRAYRFDPAARDFLEGPAW